MATTDLAQYRSDINNGKGPTGEVGQPANIGVSPFGVPGWSAWIGDELERVPELQWPNSVRTYAQMRSDAQMQGLWMGTTLPIRRFQWHVDPNGARDEVVKALAADLGLPIKGEKDQLRPRIGNRFSFSEHLRLALHALIYGHYPFEQVGEIVGDSWHLVKLAERPPITIGEINVDAQGELNFIRQQVGSVAGMAPPITADRMVWYVWEKEGANWQGRSTFRACFRNWLLKDMLLRIDASKHERNGMGIPVGFAPPNASPQALAMVSAMAQRLRAGEDAGGALPNGSDMKLLGVQGSLPDTVGSIRLQNEEMARAFLAMFMQLGQTETGSRALGSEFVDFFSLSLDTIAGDWFIPTFQAHVVEDWVTWNYGEDEQSPMISYDREEEPTFAGRDLAYLIQSGAITLDEDLENSIRERYRLPPRDPNDPLPKPPGGVQPPGDGEHPPEPAPVDTQARERQRRSVTAAATASPVALPDRPLRRQPYDHEVRASVDFAAMDSSYLSARNMLVIEYRQMQRHMIDSLHDSIIDAGGDLAALAALEAEPESADIIASRMITMANHGAQLAREEASRQGVNIEHPSLDKAKGALTKRAEATDRVLSRALSEAAGRKAIQLTGGSLSASDVAASVSGYLNGMSTKYLEDQLGGALQAAMNTGRREAIQAGPPSSIYASELLDSNTCEECTAIDGTEYQTMDDAESDYPTGGYADCAGGPRCRGTIVAVYGEAAAETNGDQ